MKLTLDELYSTQFEHLLSTMYRCREATLGVWPRFKFVEIPIMIVCYKNGKIDKVLSVNHPDPSFLGDATYIDSEFDFESVVILENISHTWFKHEIDSRKMQCIFSREDSEEFAFDMDIEHTITFIQTLNLKNSEPCDLNYFVNFLLHEQFHLFQIDHFDHRFNPSPKYNTQYDYSEKNLEQAMLENKALENAVLTDSENSTIHHIKHFLALRRTRLKRDERIILDRRQERIEGSAQYMEHIAGLWDRNMSTFHTELAISNLDNKNFPPLYWFGFHRFYTTGATIMALLDSIGVNNWQRRASERFCPDEILAEQFEIDNSRVAAMVEQASDEYDHDGSIASRAKTYAKQILDELASEA